MQNKKTVEQLIGLQIQRLRKEKGYTQQKFAEIIGLSTHYLSNVEHGVSSVSLENLSTIINALECSADDLFADVTRFGYRVKESCLSAKLKLLSPEDREKAMAILEVFIKNSKE